MCRADLTTGAEQEPEPELLPRPEWSPRDEDTLPELWGINQCCVCRSPTENILPCHHVVCPSCVSDIRRYWVPRCPTCRADLDDGTMRETPPEPQSIEWWTCPRCHAIMRDSLTCRTRHRGHCPANREPTGMEGLPDRPQTPPPPTPPRRPPRGASTHPHFRP